MCFYNHTSQEYSSELPTIESITPIDEGPAYPTNVEGLQPVETAESNNEGQAEIWEGQVWDGNDGEIFVPWPEEESHAMKTSPEAGGPREKTPDTPEGEPTPSNNLALKKGSSTAALNKFARQGQTRLSKGHVPTCLHPFRKNSEYPRLSLVNSILFCDKRTLPSLNRNTLTT